MLIMMRRNGYGIVITMCILSVISMCITLVDIFIVIAKNDMCRMFVDLYMVNTEHDMCRTLVDSFMVNTKQITTKQVTMNY